jgi:hypothetical protein
MEEQSLPYEDIAVIIDPSSLPPYMVNPTEDGCEATSKSRSYKEYYR